MTKDEWAELSRKNHAANPSCKDDCCGCTGLDLCGRERSETDRLRDLLKRLVVGCDAVVKFNVKLRECRCATCQDTYGGFREALGDARKEIR